MLKKLEAAWNITMGLSYILLTPFVCVFAMLMWMNDILNWLNNND